MQEVFSHPVIEESGWAGVGRKLANWAAEQFGEVIVDEAQNWALQSVEDWLNGPSEDAPYRLPDGTPMRPYEFPAGPNGVGDLSEVSTTLMVDTLQLVEETTPGVNPASTTTTAVMSELQTRKAEIDLIMSQIDSKLSDVEDNLNSYDTHLAGLPKLQICSWAEGISLDRIRKRLSSQTKSRVRRCITGSSDGKRVSRENHEYEYCRKSGQINEVITGFYSGSHSASQLLDASTEQDVKDNFTYGNFVDLPQLRQLIAEVRKVDRQLRSANVKSILQLVGMPISQLRSQMLSNLQYGDLADRWFQVFPETEL